MQNSAKSLLRASALAAGLSLVCAAASLASTGGMGVDTAGNTRAVQKSLTTPQTTPISAAAFNSPSSATGGIRFGSRTLRQGMRGGDVRVLNGIIRGHDYASSVKLSDRFHARTSGAVKRFQAENSIKANGIVNRRTARALAGSMKRAKSTWYGPGFYGNQTACGQTLRYGTVGVAHRNLPCGTSVTFHYQGRALVTRVIDRGPFVSGIMWDLTGAAARHLGFSGSEPVRFTIAG